MVNNSVNGSGTSRSPIRRSPSQQAEIDQMLELAELCVVNIERLNTISFEGSESLEPLTRQINSLYLNYLANQLNSQNLNSTSSN